MTVAEAQRAAIVCERAFRVKLFDANTVEQRQAAQTGLRHAVGLRQAIAALALESTSPLDSIRPASGLHEEAASTSAKSVEEAP